MNFLFVMDKYYPNPKATVICAQNVINELIRLGNKVDVIAYSSGQRNDNFQKINGSVYYIKPDLRQRLSFYAFDHRDKCISKHAERLSIFFNRIRKVLLLPWYPLYSVGFPYRLSTLIEQLVVNNKYDAVVSLYWPFESILAGYWFKKRYKKVKWFIYAIDPITKYEYSTLNKLGGMQKWFYKFFFECDAYFYMRSNKKEYLKKQFQTYNKKLFEVDIPALLDQNINPAYLSDDCKEDVSEQTVETWVYAGSLSKPHYNGKALITLFSALPKDKKRVLHIYSGGIELDELKPFEANSNGTIVLHNYISHEELVKVYNAADFLVSMKYTELISAKIFEYMSYKKRIVHLTGCANDPNAVYVNNYSKGIVIPVYATDVSENAMLLYNKLNSIKQTSKQNLNKDAFFEKNRPIYTAQLMCNILGGTNGGNQ